MTEDEAHKVLIAGLIFIVGTTYGVPMTDSHIAFGQKHLPQNTCGRCRMNEASRVLFGADLFVDHDANTVH